MIMLHIDKINLMHRSNYLHIWNVLFTFGNVFYRAVYGKDNVHVAVSLLGVCVYV